MFKYVRLKLAKFETAQQKLCSYTANLKIGLCFGFKSMGLISFLESFFIRILKQTLA